MDRFNSLKNHPTGKEKERKELDLDDVMLRLTCLSDWVAAQRGFVGLQKRVVGVVEEMLKADSDESTDISVITMFQERLDFARESLLAAEQKCQYLERSIGAQVQTVGTPCSSLLLECSWSVTNMWREDILPHRPKR